MAGGAGNSSPLSRTNPLPPVSGTESSDEAESGSFRSRSISSDGSVTSRLPPRLSSDSDSDSSSVMNRRVSHHAPGNGPIVGQGDPAQGNEPTLPANGVYNLNNGGKIIFKSSQDGKGPMTQEELSKQLDKLEKEGKLDSGSSNFSKFIKGLNTGIKFLMNSKETQVTIGLIGMGVCLGVGCVFPVALVAMGPCVLIFANGFLDNPMLTSDPSGHTPSEGNKPKPDGNETKPDGNKPDGNENNKPEDSTKNKPKPKPPSGKPDTPDSGQGDGPQGDEELRRQEKNRRQLRTRQDAERLMNQTNDELQRARLPGRLEMLDPARTQSTGNYQQAMPELLQLAEFDGDAYLAGAELRPVPGHDEDALRVSIRTRIASMKWACGLNDDESFRQADIGRTLRAEDYPIIRNAIEKAAIDHLIRAINDSGQPLPTQRAALADRRLDSRSLFIEAAEQIGIPVQPDQQKLINAVMPEETFDALNNWHAQVLEDSRISANNGRIV